MDSKKPNKIREIVRLQQILKKWRKLSNSSKSTNSYSICNNSNKGSSKSIHFLKRTLSLSDKTNSEASTNSVPKGYFAVCVGEEQKRFVIPTEYLGHHVFHVLLREAEEEFGFQHEGVLRIPCEVCMFETILKMVEEKKDIVLLHNSLHRDDMLACCFSDSQLTFSHQPESPMCR